MFGQVLVQWHVKNVGHANFGCMTIVQLANKNVGFNQNWEEKKWWVVRKNYVGYAIYLKLGVSFVGLHVWVRICMCYCGKVHFCKHNECNACVHTHSAPETNHKNGRKYRLFNAKQCAQIIADKTFVKFLIFSSTFYSKQFDNVFVHTLRVLFDSWR